MIVYDYVDALVPVLARMAVRRQRGYRALGYSIDERSLHLRLLLRGRARRQSAMSYHETFEFFAIDCCLTQSAMRALRGDLHARDDHADAFL